MDLLKYTFMQNAFISGILLSIITGIISFFIVNKNLSFLGVGLSHIAFGGIAVGIFFRINPILASLIFSLSAASIIGKLSLSYKIKEDASIGIFFSFSMALGIVFIYLKQGYSTDIFSYLFGSILTITKSDIIFLSIIFLLVVSIITIFFKTFIIMIFDPDYGKILGLKINLFYYILLYLITLIIISILKITGTVLIAGLLVLPGTTSYIISKNHIQHILLSILFAFIFTFSGLIISFYLNIPSGPTIVITGVLILFIIMGLKKIKLLISR